MPEALTNPVKDHSVKKLPGAYPNPAVDNLYIHSRGKIMSLMLYNISGEQLAGSALKNQINVKHLQPGVYFVKVTTDKGTETHKFIKE